VVIGDDVEPRRFVFYADDRDRLVRTLAYFPDVRTGRAHDLGQISAIHFWNGQGLGDELLGIGLHGRDHATHHAVIAQVPYQRARVDVGQHWNLELFQVFFRHLLRAPV